MIEDHMDPTAEAHAQVSNLLRTTVTAAAGAAEKRAQRKAQEANDAARRSDAERQALERRLAAERETAQLVWRRVERDSWWDRARPEDIGEAVAAAGAWAGTDPRARDALDRMREELQGRYGLDLADLYRDGQTVAAAPDKVREHVDAAQNAEREAQDRSTPTEGPNRWEAEVLDAAGADLGAQIVSAEGWPHLQRRLDELGAAGEDVGDRVRTAVDQRELDTAKDKSLALTWRLKRPAADSTESRQAGHAARQAATRSPAPGKPAGRTSAQRAARAADQHRRRSDRGHGQDNGPEAAAG